MIHRLSSYTVFSAQKSYDWFKYSKSNDFQLKLSSLSQCFKFFWLYVLSIGFSYALPSSLGFESTVFGRKFRNILRENETVKSFTFRDTVGANTGFNLSDLVSFMDLLVIQ